MPDTLTLIMPAPQLDPYYLAYAGQLRQLHALIRAGEGDTDRADEIRDAMDALWVTLTPESMDLARGLSADLNTVGGDATQTVSPENQAEVRREIQEAASDKNYRQALAIIRDHPGVLPAATAASFRWVYWANIGDLDSSLIFWEDAFRIDEEFANTTCLVFQSFVRNGRFEDGVRFVVRISQKTNMITPADIPDQCRQFLESIDEVHRHERTIEELRWSRGDRSKDEALKRAEEQYRKALEKMSEINATLLATSAA